MALSIDGLWKARSPDALSFKLVAVYAALVAVLVGIVLVRLNGGFSYSLDDAYIHLALAQQIALGHYGINAGEPSSPASSILWPLLLAPVSWVPLHRWAPLVLNVAFGLAECALLGRLIQRARLLGTSSTNALQWFAALAAVVCFNLTGLTLLGMEHMLQMLLVTGCLWGLLEAYEGRPVPAWTMWMAAIAPLVRYEDLAFTLALALACGTQRRWRTCGLLLVGSTIPLVLFSLFLHEHGLPPLPSSVAVKGGIAGASKAEALHNLLLGGLSNIRAIHDGQARTLTPGILVLIAGLWITRRKPLQRNVLLCAAAAVVLLYCFGPYGWFYRYDAAFRSFLLFVALLILRDRRWGAYVSVLLIFGWISFHIRPLIQTPDACIGIYRQQYQMHRFENAFWRGNVAVDDLGWVSLDHQPAEYILDLDGLASPGAAAQRIKDAAWLQEQSRRHNVGLAMVYTRKFQSIPPEWVHLGTLRQAPLRYGLLGDRRVDFFATNQGDATMLQREMAAFKQTLPPDVWIEP